MESRVGIIYDGEKHTAKSGDRVNHVCKESFNREVGPTFSKSTTTTSNLKWAAVMDRI